MKKINWKDGITCLILLLLAVAMIAGAMILGRNEFVLSLEVVGPQEMTLEYGEEYHDPGAVADFRGTILMKEGTVPQITVESNVNTSVVGEYTVTYHTEHWNYRQTAVRTVHVVDTQIPVISLKYFPGYYTLPGREYEEEGFSAYDGYDGDLTEQVERTVTEKEIVYSVCDSSGNQTEVSREIIYDDPIPPEITLLGDAQMSIYPGTEFVDPGYTAIDNCDGDVTQNVEVTGSVDIWMPGEYRIEYAVTDNYGNTATAIRNVTVQPVKYSKGTNGKVICLTFDDGPSDHTAYLLDILKKYNVKATFFVVNTGAIALVQRAATEGHTVAIHSATHQFGQIYASEEAYFADLYRMQNIITGFTGKKPMLVRFPGGTSNTVSKFNPGIMTRLTKALTEKGFRYCDWNVDSKDAAGAKTEEEVFNNVIKGIGKKSYAIVLQHDTRGFSVRAVEKIIVWGIVNGYSFWNLTDGAAVIQHGVRN